MRKIILIAFLIPLVNLSQKSTFHEPWKLEKADERIEKIRKGDVKIIFESDQDFKSNLANIKVKLKNHDFKFGVSFTQLRRFWEINLQTNI